MSRVANRLHCRRRLLSRRRVLHVASSPFPTSSEADFSDQEPPLAAGFASPRRVAYRPRPARPQNPTKPRPIPTSTSFSTTPTTSPLMATIAYILSRHGWDLSFLASLHLSLDDGALTLALITLYNSTSDATLPFSFFQWARAQSRLGVRASCAMASIAVDGGMNHIAVTLLRQVLMEVSSNVGLVFELLRETTRKRPVLKVLYSMLVDCCVRHGLLGEAVRLLGLMRKFGFYPSFRVYSVLVRNLFDKKLFDLVWQMFEEMAHWQSGTEPPVLGLLVRELCSCGALGAACQLLHDLQRRGEVNVVVYTVVVDALCRRGFLKEASSLVYKMVQIGIMADVVVLSVLADGYCKAGMPQEVVGLMSSLPCIPDAYVYNSFILILCHKGNMEEANNLLSEMFVIGVEPDSFNYTTVIDGYCKMRRLDLALRTFASMLKRGVTPTILTYTVLVGGCCVIDDVRGAEHVFHVMEMEGVQPDVTVYNVLMEGYCKNGDLNKAYELKNRMDKGGVSPDAATYNTLMDGLISRGFAKEAREFFDELVSKGYSPDKITFTNLIQIYATGGDLEEALLIWNHMCKSGMRADVVACTALLKAFCKSHRMEDANMLFHRMLRDGLKPDLILYNTLLFGFSKVGNMNEACNLLVMMKQDGIVPDNSTFEALVVGMNKIGVQDTVGCAIRKLQEIF